MIKKTLIIAEAGVNHNGDFEIAKQLIKVAAEAGADVVKFQTFSAEKLVSESAKLAEYQRENSKTGESNQYEMLKKLELPLDWHFELKSYSEELGILFCSTPFDEDLVFAASFSLNKPKSRYILAKSTEVAGASPG